MPQENLNPARTTREAWDPFKLEKKMLGHALLDDEKLKQSIIKEVPTAEE
jgi:hypothetical protein